jgi:hypothetical protein
MQHDEGRGRHRHADLALMASGCDQAHVPHKPKLVSDNGSSYIAGDLAEWLDEQRMTHVKQRARIKRQTIKHRCLQHRKLAA